MEAGRELDALIHEKVLGLAAHEEDAYENWIPIDPPKYSTDIAAAWLVVERLRSTHHISISTSATLSDERIWICRLDEMQDIDPITYMEALTAPHAICLAALVAVKAVDAS